MLPHLSGMSPNWIILTFDAWALCNTRKTRKSLIGVYLRNLLDSGKSAVVIRFNKFREPRWFHGAELASSHTPSLVLRTNLEFLACLSWPIVRCRCVRAYACFGNENVEVNQHWAAFPKLCSFILAFTRPQDRWGGEGIQIFLGNVSSAGTLRPPLLWTTFIASFERIFFNRFLIVAYLLVFWILRMHQ